MDVQKLAVFVKLGEELIPLATMTVESIIGLAKQHGNTDLVAQLQSNKAVIAADQQTVEDELKALDEEEGKDA